MIINLCLFMTLSYFFLLRPLQQDFARVKNKRMQEEYYLFQLRQVRNHYQSLDGLSYEEIRDQYNVREAYRSMR